MIRFARVAVVPLALVAISCGGGDEEGSPNDGESWCDLVTASNAIDDEFDAVDPTDAGALEAVLDKIDALSPRFRNAAPVEIKSQVDQYAETNATLVGIFRDADYNVENLDEAAIEAAISSVDDVEKDIDVYTVAECGEPLGPDDS